MTHLEHRIQAAKSSQHAYMVAKLMAIDAEKHGDKKAPKRVQEFERKEQKYARRADMLMTKEKAERRRRARA